MATSTPALLGGSVVDVKAFGGGQQFLVPFSCTLGTYATGGAPITLPTVDVQGMVLKQVFITTPIRPTGAIRYYSWDGSTAAPKVYAVVGSTGAQVADTTDLSAVTVFGFLLYTTGE